MLELLKGSSETAVDISIIVNRTRIGVAPLCYVICDKSLI